MKKSIVGLVGVGVLVFGAGLMPSTALAKCGKDCKAQIKSEVKACKTACTNPATRKTCKKECSNENKAQKLACQAATNPTPPTCGFADEESPSGAFLE